MKKLLFVFGILVALAGCILFSQTSVKNAHAVALPCNNPHNFLVDVNQAVANDPDSGNHGNWATDTFTRHLQIWQDGSTYCGKVTDNGTFVTTGPLSPNAGAALSAGIAGTVTGGATFTITGTPKANLGNIVPLPLDCSATDCVTHGTLHILLADYFDNESHSYIDWGWTYATCTNGTWVDSAINSDGSLPQDGDITNTVTESTCGPSQVTICHATNSNTHPYTYETPNIQNDGSLDGGHLNHTGPVYPTANWGDIIPPYNHGNFHYAGLNWTTQGQAIWDDDCEVSPTVTPVTPTPSVDPCANNGCVTPTPTTTSGGGSTGGDGLSDGLGCGSHDCSQHQSSGGSVLGASTGPEQAVLGASTMAGTGTFAENLMNIMFVAGTIILGAGIKSYAKEKKN